MTFKYLIFKGSLVDTQVVLFDQFTDHAAMVPEGFVAARDHLDDRIISAGKVHFVLDRIIDELQPSCISGSVTLGIPYNKERSEEDAEIIQRHGEVDV